MRHREHIPEGKGVGLSLATFDHNHRDLMKGESKIDQHAENLGLKSKSSGIRVPPHHVMAQMYGEAVIIIYTVTCDQIDEACVSFRDNLASETLSLARCVVRHDDVSLTD